MSMSFGTICPSCISALHSTLQIISWVLPSFLALHQSNANISFLCVSHFLAKLLEPHSNRWLLLTQISWIAVVPRFNGWRALHCCNRDAQEHTREVRGHIYTCPAAWAENEIKLWWATDPPTGNGWPHQKCSVAGFKAMPQFYFLLQKGDVPLLYFTGLRFLFLEQDCPHGGIMNWSYMCSFRHRITSTVHTPKIQALASVCQLQAL